MGKDRLDELSYYRLLAVKQDASIDDIQRAFHRFALRFHPDRHVEEPAAKQARAAKIFRRGAEAYRVLSDPQARRQYDQGLEKGQLRRQDSAPPGAGRPRRHSTLQVQPKARPFVAKAAEAARKGELSVARLNLQIALQHDPGHPVLEARLRDIELRLQR